MWELSGSVVGSRRGSENEHLWVGEQNRSVSGVQIHGAGAEAPALPEVTASPSLEGVVTGFVQVIQGCSSLHVGGAARFRRAVALQFLHQ